ncbi:hypothetical protein ACFQZ4_16390 [Catellatospora coxensis]
MTGDGITRRGLLTGAGAALVATGLGGCAERPGATTPAAAATTPTPTAGPTLDEAALRKKIARMMIVGFRGAQVGPDDWIMKAIAERGWAASSCSTGTNSPARAATSTPRLRSPH